MDRRPHRALDFATVATLSMRYRGALLMCIKCMSKQRLYRIQCSMSSQRSCFNAGVTRWNSRRPTTSRVAAALNTRWSSSVSRKTCQNRVAVVESRQHGRRDQLCCHFTTDEVFDLSQTAELKKTVAVDLGNFNFNFNDLDLRAPKS